MRLGWFHGIRHGNAPLLLRGTKEVSYQLSCQGDYDLRGTRPHPLRGNDRGQQVLLHWDRLPHQHGAHPRLRRLSREEGFPVEEFACCG